MSLANYRKEPICDKCGWGCAEVTYRPAVDVEAFRKQYDLDAGLRRFPDPHAGCPELGSEHLDIKCPRCRYSYQMRTMTA